MENLSPTWIVLSRIKFKILSGHSIRTALLESSRSLNNDFERNLYLWAQKHPSPFPKMQRLTSSQQSLIFLLDEGLNGKPIYESLQALEEDVHASLLAEIQEHIDKLPFLSLIPMLFFVGPAFFLLLLGPLLASLLKGLSA